MKLFTKIGMAALLGGVGGAVVMSATANAENTQAHADFSAIQRAQEQAKVENDQIKLNCLNEKLVMANGLLNIIDAGDESKVAQLHELRVAADACAGKKQLQNDGSTNSFTSPPGASEPNVPGNDWGVTFEPPANASPSMPSTPRRSGRH